MWDVVNAQYEEDVFKIDMIHSDSNENRSWTLRLGKGGQIASFIVASGEAISNQASETAAWNDLVQQMVAVNSNANTPDDPSFIHQAGPYMKDTGYVTSQAKLRRRNYDIYRYTFSDINASPPSQQHAAAILFPKPRFAV